MKSLNKNIEDLRSTILDMETEPTQGNKEHNLKKLGKIADRLQENSDAYIEVTGHGTGED